MAPEEKFLPVTREKHLDHMVKVVPLIVVGYAAQCFIILNIGREGFAINSLLFLGVCLGLMIAGFVTYDLKHKIELYDDYFVVKFSPTGTNNKVRYSDIRQIQISDKDQSFATVTITTANNNKIRFYFIDEADRIKQWLEEKQSHRQNLAA